MEWRVRWAVEARRKGRGEEQEQREQHGGRNRKSNGGSQSKGKTQDRSKVRKASKCVSVKKNADEPEVTGRLAEVSTGRGSAGLVRGGDERYWADETSRKGRGKTNGGKGEHEGKGGGVGRNEEKEEILRLLGKWQEKKMSPIVRWAWADENREAESTEEKGESGEEEKAQTQGMRRADCEDDEGRMEQVMFRTGWFGNKRRRKRDTAR